MTKSFVAGSNGAVAKLSAVRVELGAAGAIREVPSSALEIPCDLALLAMGFVGPEKKGLIEELGLDLDARGNVISDRFGATTCVGDKMKTKSPRIFAAGDASRGQSLVVWAIADGRRVAAGVHTQLMHGQGSRKPVLRAVG